MGRAARRAQERASRRQRRQQAAPQRPVVSAPATVDTPSRGGFLRPRWLIDIISELRKVTWPTRQETAHLTLVVIIVSILFGIVLGTADLGFNWLIENTILR
ncbi:MAG TPA: preprotein translocase subunit SecE [Dehalococcoidia bacterium]|jgi:preprotein translocase subunit SecE|nr:preprotein translocase subunit SecE [Dehalococcoidia bacterium]